MSSPTTERSVVEEERPRTDGVVLLRPHEVAVARALAQLTPVDGARGEFLAYLLAARMPTRPHSDDRLAVPDFIAEWAPREEQS